MDTELLKQIRAELALELREVQDRLKAYRNDIDSERKLKAQIETIDFRIGTPSQETFFGKPEQGPESGKVEEKLIDALRRVLKASDPLTAPQVSGTLRNEGRVFKNRKGKIVTGTNVIRNMLMRYGVDAPEHRRYFRRIEGGGETVYESLEKTERT